MTAAVRDRYQVDQFNQAIGAELIANKWGFSREALDEFSAAATRGRPTPRPKAGLARRSCRSVGEWPDRTDQGIRPDTSVERLATLKPAFEGLELLTAATRARFLTARPPS